MNLVKAHAFAAVAPGGRTLGHARLVDGDLRVMYATRVCGSPWNFQINQAHLEWAIGVNQDESPAGVVLLICGADGYVQMPASDLMPAVRDMFRRDRKGHDVCLVTVCRRDGHDADITPILDRQHHITARFVPK